MHYKKKAAAKKIKLVIKLTSNEECNAANKKLIYDHFPDPFTITEGSSNCYLYSLLSECINSYDWFVTVYNDAFIINPDEIYKMIAYMDENDYDVCGMPDGGTYTPRPYGNPIAINPFFTIIRAKTLRNKIRPIHEIINQQEWNNEYLLNKFPVNKYHEELLNNQSKDCFEIFYPLFYEILDKSKVLYLYGRSYTTYNNTNGITYKLGEVFPEDTITTVLYSHNNVPIVYYAWYEHTYTTNMLSEIENTERLNKDRFDRIVNRALYSNNLKTHQII
jgi:hypothetical protein